MKGNQAMTNAKRKPKAKLVTVICDPRNPKLDYVLPSARAEALLAQGKLLWDLAAATFTTPDRYAQVR
jgi:hypothetical protein